jgi:hypothetical protein
LSENAATDVDAPQAVVGILRSRLGPGPHATTRCVLLPAFFAFDCG